MEKGFTSLDHELKAEHLKAGYDKTVIIEDMSLVIPDHKITVIIGSNGCGKSTLLKTFARLIPPMGGKVLLDGKEYAAMPSRKLAQIIGLLPQSPLVPEGIKVSDLIARGRYPYQEVFRGMTKEDYAAYDLLIGMDHENMRDMLRQFNGDPDKKMHLLPEFAGEQGEVADPWYTGNFDETYDDVQKGCKGLLQLLIKNETPIL